LLQVNYGWGFGREELRCRGRFIRAGKFGGRAKGRDARDRWASLGRGSAGVRTGTLMPCVRVVRNQKRSRCSVQTKSLSVNREFGSSLFTFDHSNLQFFMVNP
jgi:hypothetical protein